VEIAMTAAAPKGAPRRTNYRSFLNAGDEERKIRRGSVVASARTDMRRLAFEAFCAQGIAALFIKYYFSKEGMENR